MRNDGREKDATISAMQDMLDSLQKKLDSKQDMRTDTPSAAAAAKLILGFPIAMVPLRVKRSKLKL